METIKDLVADGRERDGTALEIAGRAAPYSYHEFCTNAWKAANLYGHYGVHSVGDLGVAIGPKTVADDSGDGECGGPDRSRPAALGRIDAPEPLLAVLGGTLLGATVDVTPPPPGSETLIDARTFVAPAGWMGCYGTAPKCTRLAYGGPPDDPAVIHFEREAWSENPIEPPESVASDDDALRADGESYTHEALLSSAASVVDQFGLSAPDRVVLAADATEPGALVAGVLAPLSVGATIAVPESPAIEPPDETDASLVVTDAETAGDHIVQASAITRALRDIRRA